MWQKTKMRPATDDRAKAALYRIIEYGPIENKPTKLTILAARDQHSAAVASAFTDGRFSACPLPGRTYMVKAGATF
jgi:hypothetical protein